MIKYIDIIPKEVLLKLIDIHDSTEPYAEKLGMRKVDCRKAIDIIEPYLLYDFSNFVGGNFYRHNKPYFPHVDRQESWGDSIVVVVPIWYNGEMPSLVVFDQYILNGPSTWMMGYPAPNFDTNKARLGRPYDDPDVIGLTDKDISDELYEVLPKHPRSMYFGLSGNASKFKPGNAIEFDSKYIHATGQMSAYKLGLTLRFRK
jgi:hypothetical protein